VVLVGSVVDVGPSAELVGSVGLVFVVSVDELEMDVAVVLSVLSVAESPSESEGLKQPPSAAAPWSAKAMQKREEIRARKRARAKVIGPS
jgi:hypothetical protein